MHPSSPYRTEHFIPQIGSVLVGVFSQIEDFLAFYVNSYKFIISKFYVVIGPLIKYRNSSTKDDIKDERLSLLL